MTTTNWQTNNHQATATTTHDHHHQPTTTITITTTNPYWTHALLTYLQAPPHTTTNHTGIETT